MSGEIAKTLRTKLWALRLRAKDDVNKHVNDFTLYMDQLKELGREEREETLTDLFLDSIVDPQFEVTVATYRTYREWQKLTPKQRAAVIAAREKESSNKDGIGSKDEKEENNKNLEAQNKKGQQRKRTRRQANIGDNNHHGDQEDQPEDEDPL
jgi:hypothetical protein